MARDAPVTHAATTEASVVAERVREAAAAGRTLRIEAGGSWLDAGRPVAADGPLSLEAACGIVEYVPGDLTLTARAGTTLLEIARATAEHDQWLPLDPPGEAARITLGATLATASHGPLAHHAGTPRDLTLGIEVVTGAGDVVRGGGRVVKNVAGFDLTRLNIGAWGTLGVITEATVRLRARPAATTTLIVRTTLDATKLEDSSRALRSLPFVPLAAQLVNGAFASALGLSGGGGDEGDALWLVRLGGNARALEAQRDAIRRLAGNSATRVTEVGAEIWERFAAAEPRDAFVMRCSRAPSHFAPLFAELASTAARAPGAMVHGDPGRGVVRCIIPASPSRHAVAARLLGGAGDGQRSCIGERLSPALWATVPSAVSDPLQRRVHDAFDPRRILNPGILGATA